MSAQTETTKKFIEDTRSIKDRVAAVEQTIPSLIKSVGVAIDRVANQTASLKNQVDFMAEWLDALVGEFGVEKLQKLVGETRLKKAKEEADATRAETEQLKTDGLLAPAETVEDGVYLVLSEVVNDTNEPAGAGWLRVHSTDLKRDTFEKFLGKTVGHIERMENTTVTVLEILKAVKPATTVAPGVE